MARSTRGGGGGKSFDKVSTMPLTSNFYGRKSNSNVYKSFKLESRERYAEQGTGTGGSGMGPRTMLKFGLRKRHKNKSRTN